MRSSAASETWRAVVGFTVVGCVALGAASSVSVDALGAVVVQPSVTLTRETNEVPASARLHYVYSLTAGDELVFTLRSASWRGAPLRVWLLDEPNYRNLSAGLTFSFYEEGSGLAQRFAQFAFAASRTGSYYVVIDNPDRSTARQLAVYAYARLPEPSADDERTLRVYEYFYEELRALFEFEEIDIVITRCGRINAFSTPSRVVICREFDELFAQGPTPGLRLFVLMHEVAHTFLYAWGYRSIYTNQWMTDRLAATLTELMGQQEAASEAARWFASNAWLDEPSSFDAEFAMHKQRARRLEQWLTEEAMLDLAWTRRIVLPRMRTSALESMLSRQDLGARMLSRIEAELDERRQAAVP